MGKRDERYMLTNMVELDEGFFTTEVSESEKGNPLKKGRGGQRKTIVLVRSIATSVPATSELPRRVLLEGQPPGERQCGV